VIVLTGIFAALLLTASPAQAEGVSNVFNSIESFMLWNDCLPVWVGARMRPDGYRPLGLTNEQVQHETERRLQFLKDLYLKGVTSGERPLWRTLWMEVWIDHEDPDQFHVSMTFSRTHEKDGEIIGRSTWYGGSRKQEHHGKSTTILSAVANLTDKFIDEYLRVNAEACEGP